MYWRYKLDLNNANTNVACNAMTKQSSILIILTFLSLSVFGQLKINKARPIPFSSQFDSIRIHLSKFCLSNLVTESKANVDIRIYRFMAFGEKKLSNLNTNKDNLLLEIFMLQIMQTALSMTKSSTVGDRLVKT